MCSTFTKHNATIAFAWCTHLSAILRYNHAYGALTMLHSQSYLCVDVFTRNHFPATSMAQPHRLNHTRVVVSLFLTFSATTTLFLHLCAHFTSATMSRSDVRGAMTSLPSQMLQSSKVMGLLHRNDGSRRPLSALRKRIRTISAR